MGVSRWAYPDQTTGYQRGVARNNTTEKGSGMGSTSGQGWHPTVKFLLLLVIGELVAYGALRSFTKHGG
jgi:hypothetical protein